MGKAKPGIPFATPTRTTSVTHCSKTGRSTPLHARMRRWEVVPRYCCCILTRFEAPNPRGSKDCIALRARFRANAGNICSASRRFRCQAVRSEKPPASEPGFQNWTPKSAMFQSKDVEEVALQGLSHRSIASRDITTTGLCWPKNDTGAAFSCDKLLSSRFRISLRG